MISDSNRFYNMDALRVLAMLMIVVLHFNLFTGLSAIPLAEYPFSRFLSGAERSFCFCAVNVYAMLTGYFCINSMRFKLERYVRLWFHVAFYTVGIYASVALGAWLWPGMIALPQVGLYMLYPIPLASGYWYFNAYSVLFFMIPFMNRFLTQLPKSSYIQFLLLVLFAIPALQILGIETAWDAGYNPLWLAVMYCTGAYLRLHPIAMRRRWLVLVMVTLVIIMVGLGCLTASGASGSSYCMPHYVVMGICLMLFFTRTTIRALWLCKLISWAALLAFGVYIIHLHPCIWGRIPEWIAMAGEYRMQWWFIPAASLALFVACLHIDYCRSVLFRICRVEVLVRWITRGCIWGYQSTVGKMLARIESKTDDV